MEGFADIRTMLEEYVNPYNKTDKFTACGYNVSFDLGFLHSFFQKCGDLFFYSFVFKQTLDLLPVVIFLQRAGLIEVENCKLETVCKHFDIEVVAHNAWADVAATRELYEKLTTGMDGNLRF